LEQSLTVISDIYLNLHIFHISLFDIIALGVLFTGLNFALLLLFTKSSNRIANRFLVFALLIMLLWMTRLLAIEIRLENYVPGWNHLPMQFLMALGPLLYFYVLKITRRVYKFTRRDGLHFIPLLIQQLFFIVEIRGLVLQLLIFISVLTYLFYSRLLILRFNHNRKPVFMDRSLLQYRWLQRLLTASMFFWLGGLIFIVAGYIINGIGTEISIYFPLSVLYTLLITWIVAAAYLRLQPRVETSPVIPPVPVELRQKAIELKIQVNLKKYYEDPELTLTSLARSLDLPVHELSRIINTGLKKSFSDFINQCRVREVIRKMQNPAFDHITLIGMAYDSGFNSKSTFNRIFKQFTGKSPVEYKNDLKKEFPAYKLRPHADLRRLFLQRYTTSVCSSVKLNRIYMFENYVKIAWRNFTRNKFSSFINLGGLAVGITVAMLIGLWIADELSFNKYHRNYDRIAMVMQNKTFNGTINTDATIPLPLDEAMRKNYNADFKHIVLTAWNEKHVLNAGERNLSFTGNFMSPDAPEMLTLRMVSGNSRGLADKSSLLLSVSTAKAIFGDSDPVSKVIRMDGKDIFKVTGVYEDIPGNTTFHELAFIGSIDYYLHAPGNERSLTDWGDNSLFMYVQLADNTDMATVSGKIRDIKLNSIPEEDRKFKPAIFLQPMKKWHLYSEFKNGVNTGGAIQYVWLFAIIGLFVLLLACINFMNLSTARSEKRAREVGIRKAIGSLKHQLVKQFYCESLLIAFLSFVVSVTLLWIALSWFNTIAGKQITMPLTNPLFWLACIGFTFFTGMLAGSYPALYLSSFNPVKVLKGSFKAGPSAALPRKILVVAQFTVSIVLIVCVAIVFKQVQFAKDRPIGYSRAGLVDIELTNDDLYKHFDAVKSDLLSSAAVLSVAQASGSTTGVNNNRGDIEWTGKDPAQADFFGSIRVSVEYGKTVGWQFTEGHDFAVGNKADSLSVVLNEAAAAYMGFKQAAGKIIHVGQKELTVIGVVKNIVMESPYEPVKQTIFYLGKGPFADILIRLNPQLGAHKAIDEVAAVCKIYSPSVPFSYRFADDEYAKKFTIEERIGKLAAAFAVLAIFISCMGLFGMASFMAEQRVKEIGIRKILGASVFGLWRLMSKDFMVLIVISFLIAAPLGFIFMQHWLLQYSYRTGISGWIFAVTAAGALLITLLTVSYQTIRAALANPVKSLRSE
jgi:putative ABC transport system permease protein